ncbi:hypothetical protein VT91_36590 [Clostridium sporogenes]|nr:hypothetical protein VT91_35970 [Clostridium sporogenes]KRU24072.1 hypothetical protein VT91_36590 [Clostridium sporogenes]KRU28874.1 hypothetical protein WG71_17330 [Clostridium sporogenes]KRU35787.1 hypothetical protein VT28_00610 [Clostridium sporogenes]KRU47144.1 hypothetical protein VT95_08640 [Clostridium sporogenes]
MVELKGSDNMKIVLAIGLLFYMMFVNWYSLNEFKQGKKLKAIYDLLIFIATALFIITIQVLLK